MKGIKILVGATAVAAVGAGAAGILMNTKKARMRRIVKNAGKVMCSVGNVLQVLSCNIMPSN